MHRPIGSSPRGQFEWPQPSARIGSVNRPSRSSGATASSWRRSRVAVLSRRRRASGGPRRRCGSARSGRRRASWPAAARARAPRGQRGPGVARHEPEPEVGDALGVALDHHVALEHDAAQLGVPVAPGLDLDRRARVALEVLDLLRLAEGPGEEDGTVVDVPEGMRCGRRFGPSVAQVKTRSSSRKRSSSWSDIVISLRRDGMVSTLASGPRRGGAACPRGSAPGCR